MISRPTLFRIAASMGLPMLASPNFIGAAAARSAPGTFDRVEFERRISLAYRHRQVFAASKLDGGVVLDYIENSLKAYADADGFAEGPGTLHAAAVLYGSSIATVLSDAAWMQYRLASFLRRYGQHLPDGVATSPYREMALRLRAAGVSFFVCRNALHNVADALAAAPEGNGISASEIFLDLSQNFVADALLVPAGVAALNALQEANFTLVAATSGAG